MRLSRYDSLPRKMSVGKFPESNLPAARKWLSGADREAQTIVLSASHQARR